jgi:hypothetical protein
MEFSFATVYLRGLYIIQLSINNIPVFTIIEYQMDTHLSNCRPSLQMKQCFHQFKCDPLKDIVFLTFETDQFLFLAMWDFLILH